MPRIKRRPNLRDLYRVARSHAGTVEPDDCGGLEIVAPSGQRWIDAKVQCYVLPLNEIEPEHHAEEIQRCIDLIERGTEPYPGG